jgi:undecaprenyl diphosphate synthase
MKSPTLVLPHKDTSTFLEERQKAGFNPNAVLPKHVAIIMDGNRRWARDRHWPTLMGHKEGSERLKEIIREAASLGLEGLTVYAFSTENWQRSADEIRYLMVLMAKVLSKELKAIAKLGVRVHLLGDATPLPPTLKRVLHKAVHTTASNTGMVLQLAINYGGRAELTHAVKNLMHSALAGTLHPDALTEADIEKHLLHLQGLPPPDLLIRTSGEQRLSNFLLWQLAYSELYFTPEPWPAFTIASFHEALRCFDSRQRRFGS